MYLSYGIIKKKIIFFVEIYRILIPIHRVSKESCSIFIAPPLHENEQDFMEHTVLEHIVTALKEY